MRKPKTPLRYPGGKSRMAKKLVDAMPQNIESFYEGFLGGGSVSLEVTRRYPGCKVTVNDLFFPLYAFWTVMRDNPHEMYNLLIEMKKETDGRAMYKRCREQVIAMTDVTVEDAAAFYVVNKCGFSGILNGYSQQAWEQNFTERGIETPVILSEEIQEWTINNGDYSNWGNADVVYLDPPYEIKTYLYGNRGEMHEGFSHEEFVNRMEENRNTGTKFLISYNQEMGDRFSNEWEKLYFDHTYTMRSTKEYVEKQKQNKELLLIN